MKTKKYVNWGAICISHGLTFLLPKKGGLIPQREMVDSDMAQILELLDWNF